VPEELYARHEHFKSNCVISIKRIRKALATERYPYRGHAIILTHYSLGYQINPAWFNHPLIERTQHIAKGPP
jgi:hypothetical protein